jgi:hypothetical protein
LLKTINKSQLKERIQTMKRNESAKTIAAFVLMFLLGAISQTQADILQFTASGPAVPNLSGLNENPANNSPATGTAIVTWDTATNKMTVATVFNNLTTPNTAAHIHCCTMPPNNVGVATTVPTFTGFPTGATSGTYLRTFDMLSAASYNPGFITAHGGTVATALADLLAGLQAGQSYLNIHSQMFPGGEIRGFLQPATEAPACPRGLGYWKKHASAWPVNSLTLGCQTYSGEELLALLRMPVRGDASIILAHQLISAKLNVFNGSNPMPVSDAFTQADTLLCTFNGKLPYNVKPSSAAGRQMTTLGGTLGSFNDGGTPSNCTP